MILKETLNITYNGTVWPETEIVTNNTKFEINIHVIVLYF